MDLPPTLSEIGAKLEDLDRQATTILYLSAVNLIANALTVLVAFLAVTA